MSTEMLTMLEVERRLPVWHAMSDLFLDTEWQREDYRRIANILAMSRYSLAELRSIFEDDVAPVFGSNLLSAAGEWAGWSQSDVRTIMLRSRRDGWLVSRLKRLLYRRCIEQEWKKIEQLLKGE